MEITNNLFVVNADMKSQSTLMLVKTTI